MIRLKELNARACRGIIDGPALIFGNGGLIMCADNGMGKSSFIDAIEKVLTGQCSSLDIGDRSISWSKHGSHISTSKGPVIELTLTDGVEDKIVNNDSETVIHHESFRRFLEAARQRSFILRRRTVLDFINAKPQQRYMAIEAFINIDDFKRFETRMRDMAKAAELKKMQIESDIGQNQQALITQLRIENVENLDESLCLCRLNEGLKEIGQLDVLSDKEAVERMKQIDAEIEKFGNMAEFQGINTTANLTNNLTPLDDLSQNLAEYLSASQEYMEEKNKLEGQFYISVLKDGLTWIKEDAMERCPLCNNKIDAKEVEKFVNDKLKANELLTSLDEKQKRYKSTVLGIIDDHIRQITELKTAFNESIETKFPEIGYKLLEWLERWAADIREAARAEIIARDLDSLKSIDFAGLKAVCTRIIRDQMAAFPDAEKYERMLRVRKEILVFTKQWPKLVKNHKKIKHVENSISNLKALISLAESSRKRSVQLLLDKVAEIADRYFQRIHPNEHIGKPELKIKDHGKGSINLESEFYGRESDPRGLYSEGHVDSLGLCLFLAIRKLHHMQTPEFALLILDDVMHSVDGSHRLATADLIFEEFSDHQLIITTHDPLWFENLKECANRSKGARRFKFHRIANWSIDTGPQWGDHLSDYEWLVSEKMRTAKPCDKAIKAGRLLESCLQNLCDSLRILVPFNIKGLYTLDPLWTNFLKTAKRQKGFYETAISCLNSIEGLRKIRSWVGAHYNEWASQLTDEESNEFADAVVQLRLYTYCDSCRRFIMDIPELKNIWSCKCESIRYSKSVPASDGKK